MSSNILTNYSNYMNRTNHVIQTLTSILHNQHTTYDNLLHHYISRHSSRNTHETPYSRSGLYTTYRRVNQYNNVYDLSANLDNDMNSNVDVSSTKTTKNTTNGLIIAPLVEPQWPQHPIINVAFNFLCLRFFQKRKARVHFFSVCHDCACC